MRGTLRLARMRRSSMQVMVFVTCCLVPRRARARNVSRDGRKTLSKVRDQIGGVFQSDVETHQRAAIPTADARISQRQALVAAPRCADAEQAQAVDEPVRMGLGQRGL